MTAIDHEDSQAEQMRSDDDVFPISTAGRCRVTYRSDADRGGWLVECDRHGRLGNCLENGDAEELGQRHDYTWIRIDGGRSGISAALVSTATIQNPVLSLPAVAKLQRLDPETRALLREALLELRVDANAKAENAWRRRKGPMAAYWRATSTYAGHFARALR